MLIPNADFASTAATVDAEKLSQIWSVVDVRCALPESTMMQHWLSQKMRWTQMRQVHIMLCSTGGTSYHYTCGTHQLLQTECPGPVTEHIGQGRSQVLDHGNHVQLDRHGHQARKWCHVSQVDSLGHVHAADAWGLSCSLPFGIANKVSFS